MNSSIIKDFHFDQEGREKLLKGIETISKSVKSTLGPRGRTVIIESPNHTNGITVTKDGVTVAKSVTVEDPVESLAVQIIRAASENTASSAGDGTTTAIVIAEAMVSEALKNQKIQEMNTWSVVEHINKYAADIETYLQSISKPIDDYESIKQVATISANNDPEIGEIIASAYEKVGKNGLVTVQNSLDENTTVESTAGIRIDRGYYSEHFSNNQKRDECILEDAYVLMTDIEISTVTQIELLLKQIVSKRDKLLIIAPCSAQFVSTMAMNVVKNKLGFCLIEPPQFGYKSQEMMSDIAVATGGKFFSQSTGDDLSLISIEDLGFVKKVVSSREKTTIVPDQDNTDETIDYRVLELKVQASEARDKKSKDFLNERIAILKGGISTVFVGGSSDVDQKERYDRVDDAVCAVRSAIEEGVVIGGGQALLRAVGQYRGYTSISPEDDAAMSIVIAGCVYPFFQIMKNAGTVESSIEEYCERYVLNKDSNIGMNVKTMEEVDMFEAGIIDPLKVTRNAFKNAVSVVTTIINTNAIITLRRE